MIVKHLYQRTIVKNGKKQKVWYFWYWHNGKQVRKSCKTSVKRDAMAYLASLKDEDLIPEIPKEIVTLRQFCTGMFDENSTYLRKLKNRGEEFSKTTLKQKVFYLGKILDYFGDMNVKDLNTGIIDDWLISQDASNSWRNNVAAIFRAIFKELILYNLIDKIPYVEKYKRNDKKEKGILYLEEIHRLFPEDTSELLKIWKHENEVQDMIFATLVYTTLSTGMRNGEIRALQWNQFIRNDTILVNAMYNADGDRVEHLKAWNDTNSKWRLVVLPEKTVKMLDTMHKMEDTKESPFVFEYRGKPYDGNYISRHLQDMLEKNGIPAKERNVTLHSLRFTYNTMLKREISTEDLRLMVGHISAKMTDYYDKVRVMDQLPELLKNKNAIDNVFN